MDKDLLGWAILIFAVACLAAAVAIPVAYYCTSVDRAAIQAGLSQRIEQNRTIWVKPGQ